MAASYDVDASTLWMVDVTEPGGVGASQDLSAVVGNGWPFYIEATWSSTWAAHPLQSPDGSVVYVHDLVNAPLGPLTALDTLPPTIDLSTAISTGGEMLAVVLRNGANELHLVPLGDSVGAPMLTDAPREIGVPTFDRTGERLVFSGANPSVMNPNPVRQLYGLEVVDGVPQPALPLTDLPDGTLGVTFVQAMTDDAVFFGVGTTNVITTSALYRGDLSSWPVIDAQPLHPDSDVEAHRWDITAEGDRVLWLHGPGDGLSGRAELIEIVDGVAQPPLAFSAPDNLDVNSGVLSYNGRYALFIGSDNVLYAADLDAADPSVATFVSDIHYEIFGQHIARAGDWVAWRDTVGALKILYTDDELGEDVVVTELGTVIGEYAGDGFGGDRCGLLYYLLPNEDQVWVMDLSGPVPGEPQQLDHELVPEQGHSGVSFFSPVDDRLFYGTIGDQADIAGWEIGWPNGAPAFVWPRSWHHLIAVGQWVAERPG